LQSNGTPKGNRLAAQFDDIDLQYIQKKAEWIAMLRSQSVKGAHPEDGWVDPDFLD
jgi:hypothetical protein